jgi:PAS domain S-box-containing protein
MSDGLKAKIDSGEQLRLATDAAGMFAWEIDITSNVLHWGANASRVIGCPVSQLTHDPTDATFFAIPEDRAKILELFEYALKSGEKFYSMEFRGNGGPDRAVWRVHGTFIRDETGQAVRTVGTTQNITKERRVAHELNLATERLTAAEEASGALLYDWDVIHNRVWRSSGLTRVFGWAQDEISESLQGWTDLRHPDDPQSVNWLSDLEGELVDDRYLFEYRVRHKSGKYVWVLDSGGVYRDQNGKIIRVAGATVDISARKSAENSQTRQNTLIELSFEPIFVWAPDKGIVDWNKGAELLYGYSKAEALGRSAHDLLQTVGSHSIAALINVLQKEKTWAGEVEQRASNGRRVLVECRLQAFDNDSEMLVLETNRDVTERHRADAYIARMAAVALASHDALFGITLEGYVETWNPGAERLFGYKAEEIIGQHISILADQTRHAEQQELMQRAQFDRTVGPYEARRMRKDGTFVDVSVSLAPVKTADGKVLSLSVAVHDITDRKEWEARQKLMTRELAHRIKNSFAVLQGILRSTLRSAKNPQDFAEAFSGRLQSLAAAQDVLTANDWRGAELAALARLQLSAYVEMDDGRVEIVGPRVGLPADYAAPFGLVFNELATNAVKYGSLSVPTGSVLIFWTLERQIDGRSKVNLTWQERGGPKPQDSPPRGFGSSLIQKSLAGAKLQTCYEPEGLRCIIEVLLPAPR